MSRLLNAVPIAILALLACRDEPRATHVYSSPAPVPKRVTPAATPSAPELPIGTRAPGAQLLAISDAATGAPVALGDIADSIDVMTVVAFGPTLISREGGRVELTLRGGTMDTTLVLPLHPPAPSVVAHVFRLAGLRQGRYGCVVRLRLRDGRLLAESIPLYIEVGGA
ncbi:MAG: hypothetical protein ABJE10_08930 [bacterium]